MGGGHILLLARGDFDTLCVFAQVRGFMLAVDFKRYYSLEGTRLPADRRYANRVQNLKTGVELRTELRDKIVSLSA